MKISADELKQAYGNMSDGELLGLDRDELTDVARKCLADELARRGLEKRPGEAPVMRDEDGETWACAGIFRTADEATFVTGLLESSGIPTMLEQDVGNLLWMGSNPVHTSR